MLKNYLDRVTIGATLSPTERVHDLYEALYLFRNDVKVDADNLALVGYSHGGSVVLEALTLTGNKIPPPGDDVFHSKEHSLKGVRAATVYYPNCRPGTYFEQHAEIEKIDLQVHLAEQDEYVRPDLCQSVIDRFDLPPDSIRLQVHYYDEKHAFDMKEYVAAYSEKSKNLAFGRTLQFTCDAIDPKYHSSCIAD